VYEFQAELWRWTGESAWHFITIPGAVSDDIDARTESTRRGFGSVRVQARIGSTTWSTSVFPDKERQAFVLPVKKEVRTAEGIEEGDTVTVQIHIVDGELVREAHRQAAATAVSRHADDDQAFIDAVGLDDE
jgi:hypothetical protein